MVKIKKGTLRPPLLSDFNCSDFLFQQLYFGNGLLLAAYYRQLVHIQGLLVVITLFTWCKLGAPCCFFKDFTLGIIKLSLIYFRLSDHLTDLRFNLSCF